VYENEKTRPIETILGMGGEDDDGRGEFNYDIL
jgi:hypothetical protein